MASSVGAGDAERPVSHRGTTGRDAQRSDRAGPAKYYPEPQTRSAGSVAPAGDSERIAFGEDCDAVPPHWHMRSGSLVRIPFCAPGGRGTEGVSS